jgi:plastocyanin
MMTFIRSISFTLVLILSIVVALFDARAAATISGKVELPKTERTPVMTKRYEIVSQGGVLAPNPPAAIVYLEGAFPRPTNAPVQQIVQTNYAFVPSLLPIQAGTRIEFPNQDNAFHNVFSYSSPKRFDLGRYRPEDRPIPSQFFDKPGLVTLRCDIHEHMRALILVLETPYFVVTDPDGQFKLEGLPEGSHVLKAWINSKVTLEQPINLTNSQILNVSFESNQRKGKPAK